MLKELPRYIVVAVGAVSGAVLGIYILLFGITIRIRLILIPNY